MLSFTFDRKLNIRVGEASALKMPNNIGANVTIMFNEKNSLVISKYWIFNGY